MTERKEHTTRTTKRRIPDFANREEMAKFWDTHDVSDYWDELKPVKVRVAKRLSEGLNIRLDPDTLAQLRAQAAEKGIGPTTLARMWILEQVKKAEHSPRP